MNHTSPTEPDHGPRRPRSRRCPVSGKARFRDHAHAVDAVHSAQSARWRAAGDGVPCRRREVRPYECEHCCGWHLTSQPPRDDAQAQR